MNLRKAVTGAVAVAAAVAGMALPAGTANATYFPESSCGQWETFMSYYGPGGPGTDGFKHMSTRSCIVKSIAGGNEYFAGKGTIYNGFLPAGWNPGYWNGKWGARYVQFGTITGGNAMVGLKMGYKDQNGWSTNKVLKGPKGSPTNDCYSGELLAGYSVSCEALPTIDNSPSSGNVISTSFQVKGMMWDGDEYWEGRGAEWTDSPEIG
ncbi:hypothetical protein ABZV60_23095 [Streptomyces sp. NPDC004787]|uniref:hypothetical protein n=1 Tax=Streptomyces sp. NPDC004787 TaxID=3154291 RepID=UPI00339F54A5